MESSDLTKGGLIKLMSTMADMTESEFPLSHTKHKFLRGLIKGYELCFCSNIGESLDERFLYSLNRGVRTKNGPMPPTSLTGFRDVQVDLPGLGEAVSPNIVPNLMSRLFFLASNNCDNLCTLEKAALIKGGIFLVQPNGDGNKRSGTILANSYLLQEGFEPVSFECKGDFFDRIMIPLWDKMYSEDSFINGREVYDRKSYAPLVKHIRAHQSF